MRSLGGVYGWLVILASILLPGSSPAEDLASSFQDVAFQDAVSDEAAIDLADPDASEAEDPLEMDIEQLRRTSVSPALEMEVTSVARTAQPVRRSPAAVYVITNEMIKRSGAKTIPDILRTVPGVNVARISGTAWAISIRGSNAEFGNKLLVQIDGRAIYTPTFSGVFWDQERVLLKDVDRIEVIRGPGATLWGANAVNGIINIVTKSAKETTGVYAEVGGGTELRDFSRARVGGRISDDLHYRVYGQHMNNDNGFAQPMREDEHRHGQGGARIDWTPTCRDTFTLSGDYLDGFSGPGRVAQLSGAPTMGEDIRRANALARWSHQVDDTTGWSLQSYYNHFNRVSAAVVTEDVFDVDCQYNTRIGCRHDVVTGLGYRSYSTNMGFPATGPLTYDPEKSTFDTISYFVQDTITLVEDRWFLMLGSKMLHSDFTDFEYQPSVKLTFTPDDRTSIWSSISRSVRTPSNTDRDITLTLPRVGGGFLRVDGNQLFKSEEALTYEMGIRRQATERFYWDLATFFARYDKLQTHNKLAALPGGPPDIYPWPIENGGSMDTYGFELAATYDVTESWRLHGSYSFLVERMQVTPPATFFITLPGNSPRNMAFLQSSMDLTCTIDLDLMFRYVDRLTTDAGAPSYFVMDARLGWEPCEGLEFSVVGRNLFGDRRREIGRPTATEIEQEVYGYVSWEY